MLSEEFLKYAAQFVKPVVVLDEGEDETFSKVGGYPTVPADFVWPKNSQNEDIPFFMQLDFAKINRNNVLTDFPQKGLIYLFVDEEAINSAYEYTQGEEYKIIFYPDYSGESEGFVEAHSDSHVYEQAYITTSQKNMYPYCEEDQQLEEMVDALSEEDQDDYFLNYHYQDVLIALVGGWPQILQSSYLQNDETQLFELQTIEDYCTWGDLGMLQFYMKKEDLKNGNFENVKVNLETT